jgi:cell shape-determining protein MreC
MLIKSHLVRIASSMIVLATVATGFATERVVKMRHSQSRIADEITNTATRSLGDPRNPPQPYDIFLAGNTSEVYTVAEVNALLRQRDDQLESLKANIKLLSQRNDALTERIDEMQRAAKESATTK